MITYLIGNIRFKDEDTYIEIDDESEFEEAYYNLLEEEKWSEYDTYIYKL